MTKHHTHEPHQHAHEPHQHRQHPSSSDNHHHPASHYNHHHHDHHELDTTSRAFAIGVALNMAFVLIETGFGMSANSLSLLADAGHNFSDVIGLLLAWGATLLSKRAPSNRFTYGLRSSTILAALANSMLLLIAVGGICREAWQRFYAPAAVSENIMIGVALIGVVINIATAMMLMHGHKNDLNIRGAFVHMVADAAVSAGVAIAGAGMILTGWLWLDPAISLLIAIVIFFGTWGLFKQSLRLSLQAVPDHIDCSSVKHYLEQLPNVAEVHDLHIWGISTTESALTAHLLMRDNHPGNEFLAEITHELEHRFRIQHSTIQIEVGDGLVHPATRSGTV